MWKTKLLIAISVALGLAASSMAQGSPESPSAVYVPPAHEIAITQATAQGTGKDLSPTGSALVCSGIEIQSAGGLIFADSFETGNLSAWSPGGGFSAKTIVDLNFKVVFDSALPGDHLLHLKLTTPKGHHYQTLTTPISAAADAAALQVRTRNVAGFPFPLAVSTLSPASDGSMSADFTMPLAGTQVVIHSLYGEWKAEAFLDQAQAPCGPEKSFLLSP